MCVCVYRYICVCVYECVCLVVCVCVQCRNFMRGPDVAM